jgi:hypothetical protein
MAQLSKKRLYIYLTLLILLAGVFLGGEAGILPLTGGAKFGIFRAPRERFAGVHEGSRLQGSFDGADEAQMIGFIAGAAPSGSPLPTVDPFEAELRGLANGGASEGAAGELGADAQGLVTPTPIASIGPTSEPVAPQALRSGLDPDDGRSIFQGLEQPLGSTVSEVIPGIVARGPGGAALPVTPVGTPTGRGWVGGQARGYTMLYAMQSEARAVVESQVEALLSARVREPHIGVLIDGTFGRDFSYLRDIITRLSSDGRKLTLVLYLSNGPTMRIWRTTPINQRIFAGISPEEFRATIRRDVTRRAEFLGVVLQAKDVFQHSLTVGPENKNIAVVMLEDNLDVNAYRALREIAAEQFGSLVRFVRNPCIGCRDGNDDNTLGDSREEHQLQRFDLLGTGDGYSLDGEGFTYPGGVESSANDGDKVNPEQLVNIINLAKQRGLGYFGLWRHAWQGVREGVPNSRPEERVYGVSSPDQLSFEVEMLRTALAPEDSGGDEEGNTADSP